MRQSHLLFLIPAVCLLIGLAESAHKCVWVRGALHCRKNASKHFNVEVRVYDRDGIAFLKMIDPDDLMGVTFTDHDGTFQLDGCGDDFNWIPGIPNNPDPYVRIVHYCNSPKGEVIELPEFDTFVPETYDIGILVLDDVKEKLPRQKDIFGRFLDSFGERMHGNTTKTTFTLSETPSVVNSEGRIVKLDNADSSEIRAKGEGTTDTATFAIDNVRENGRTALDRYRTTTPDESPSLETSTQVEVPANSGELRKRRLRNQ